MNNSNLKKSKIKKNKMKQNKFNNYNKIKKLNLSIILI